MKVFIGILIGISLMFAFQKIMKEQEKTVDSVENSAPQIAAKEPIPGDFFVFYTKFHEDSLYQMEHINFPLEGIPEYADSTVLAQDNFRWEKDKWRMHRIMDSRKETFQEDLILVSDGLVFEFVPTGDKKLWIERRFLKSNGEWRMIYYSGLNKRN